MPCKHAALAAIYAQQMAEMDEPWLLWEGKPEVCEKFVAMGYHFIFEDTWDFRLKTKTLSINGLDVPEPMREKPEIGTKYWYIETSSDALCDWTTWQDDESDNRHLRLGDCHLTRDNCIAHAKALFSFSELKD